MKNFDTELYRIQLIERENDIEVEIQNLFLEFIDKPFHYEIHQALLAERTGVQTAINWLDKYDELQKKRKQTK